MFNHSIITEVAVDDFANKVAQQVVREMAKNQAQSTPKRSSVAEVVGSIVLTGMFLWGVGKVLNIIENEKEVTVIQGPQGPRGPKGDKGDPGSISKEE